MWTALDPNRTRLASVLVSLYSNGFIFFPAILYVGMHLHLDVLQLHRGRRGIRGKQEHRERGQSAHHEGDGGEEAEDRLRAVESGVHCAGDVVDGGRAALRRADEASWACLGLIDKKRTAESSISSPSPPSTIQLVLSRPDN